MAGKKSTNAEKEWRIARVAALKARNVPTSEAVAYMTREWGVSTRQAMRYISWANEVITKDWDIDRRQLTAELLAQLTSLAQETCKSSQPSVTLGCINSIARIARILD